MTELHDWWQTAFTEDERTVVLAKYQPLLMGVGTGSPGTVNRIIRPDGTTTLALCALATWFISPKDNLPLARRILAKGIECGETKKGKALERHFNLHHAIKVFYSDRDRSDDALGLAVRMCQDQIRLGPTAAKAFRREGGGQLPVHTGFKQLAIIREKERDYLGAITVSQQATDQGWKGDWDKRIARCEARIAKAQ